MRWLHTDNLANKVLKKDAQKAILATLGLIPIHFFIEMYDYESLEDFTNPHKLLKWIVKKTDKVINLDEVEAPKKDDNLLKAMKKRFPNTSVLYKHRELAPQGLHNPNYIADYHPTNLLMRKEIGYTSLEVDYAKEQNQRMNFRTNKPEEELEKCWAGNPIHTSKNEFTRISTLNLVRNMNLTADRFPYVLRSFGPFLKGINSGNANMLMRPLDQAISLHISAAKDSMFEGLCEWLEAVLLLVAPDQLTPEKLIFWKSTAESIPVVVDGYAKLNAHFKKLTEIKSYKHMNRDKKLKLIFDLLQHFPLKQKGTTVRDRLTKLPEKTDTEEFPEIFRKAFALEKQKNNSRFQQKADTPARTTGGKTLSAKDFQQYKDLKKAQGNRRQQNDKKKNSAKRKREADKRAEAAKKTKTGDNG